MFLLKALVLKKNGIVSFSDNFFSTTKNIEVEYIYLINYLDA